MTTRLVPLLGKGRPIAQRGPMQRPEGPRKRPQPVDGPDHHSGGSDTAEPPSRNGVPDTPDEPRSAPMSVGAS